MSHTNTNLDEADRSLSRSQQSADGIATDSFTDIWKATINDVDPGGVKAISRWLSAATPPETKSTTLSSPTPEGAQQVAILAAPPPGSDEIDNNNSHTGGVAALNYRLIAAIPPGSKSDYSESQESDGEPIQRLREAVSIPGFYLHDCFKTAAALQRILDKYQVKS